MNKFEKVKNYFEAGLWTIKRLENAVIKGWITPEQYEEIKGSETKCTDHTMH